MTGSTAPELPLTVAPADGHPVVRAGLKTLLEADSGLRVVGEFEDLPRMLGGVPIVKPDVLVLDLAWQGNRAWAGCRRCWRLPRA